MPLQKVGNIYGSGGGLKKVGNIKEGFKPPSTTPPNVSRETFAHAQNLQPPTGASGLYQNFKTDFGSFAKGILGLGRQAITHPIDTGGKVYGIGKEAVKLLPGAAKELGYNMAHFPETQRKGIEALGQLRQIPLEKQKEMLASDIKTIGERAKENPDQRRLAQLGLALLGNYSQYSRPKEKIYNEPFSFALDAIPIAKGAGVGEVAKFAGKQAERIPGVSKALEVANDAFVPGGKLKRLGYGDVAADVQKTGDAMRKAQEGIIKSTVTKFKGLSQTERGQFFDAIDTLRRSDAIPTHPNPKVQSMIDWYMKEELPRIQKVAGYKATQAPITPAKPTGLPKPPLQVGNKRLEPILDHYKQFPQGVDIDAVKAEFKNDQTALEAISEAQREVKKNAVNAKLLSQKERVVMEKMNDAKTVGELMSAQEEMRKFSQPKGITPLQSPKTPLGGTFPSTAPITNNAPIKNYLHHYFNPSKEIRMGGKLSAPQRGFLKRSKDVEGFSRDPVVSIAGVKTKAATANIKDSMIKRITDKYAKPADTVTEFKNGTILEKGTGTPLVKWKGQYLPKDLGEELLRFEGKGKTVVDTLTTPLKVFNRNWKPLATAVRPRYHLRNVIGNVYNASFVGNANPLRYVQAIGQQMKGFIAQNIKDGTFAGQVYKKLFKQAPEHRYIKMATEDGVIGRGFFAADINDLADIADTTGDFVKAIDKMNNPAEIYRVPVLRQWLQASSSIGQAFEDNARLALYIDRLRKGASRAQAKTYVNKHLFDYINGLGEGDKAIKAIIPFWSWTRFNVPLQYGSLWKNPVRNVVAQEFGKPYVQQNESNNPEYKYLSEREKDMGSLKVGEVSKDGKTYDQYMRTQGVLPIQDIAKFTEPENAGVSPVFGMVKQAYRRAVAPDSPQQNLDYFGRPVENFPGEVKNFLGMPVRGTTKEILQDIPAISEVNKLFGGSYQPEQRPDLASRLKTVILPTSETIQDREKNQQYYYQDLARKTGGSYAPGFETEFKYAVKNLLKNPGDSVANKNLETLTNLLRQNGFSEYDIQKSITEAITSYKKSDQYQSTNRDDFMRNIESIKAKPFFLPSQ